MLTELASEVYRRDPVLAVTGWAHVALLGGMLLVAPFDSRTVMSINPWIKPMKFAVSITVYLWTLAWFLKYLPGSRWVVRAISWGASIAMFSEIVCIALQAGRGTTSHYNVSTPFDAAVFATMASMIFVNTFLLIALLVLFFAKRVNLPRSYLWGIRFGILLLLLASSEGFVMIAHRAHTVGLPDGGPGMPVVNWSTKAGDLRAAHFVGLHAFQILPLIGFAVSRWKSDSPTWLQSAYVFGAATVYLALMVFSFVHALTGRPLVSA